ncbi:MAG: type IX secretion system membrane protein PorP/SprF [Flavobacteriaceae bacterium]|nr:type IX secretion system membrane protein PorP/SprF [Flavobacteriaceae bacterium]
MRKLIIIGAILACALTAKAQELKLSPYTQYLAENPFVISPTFAGIDEEMSRLRLGGVAQWLGLDNAPNTQTLSFDTRLNNERSGVGILLYNDKNGNTKQIGGQLSYAHHLTLNDANEQYLSLGISYKFNHFKIDTDNFTTGNPDEPVDDPSIGASPSTSNHNFEFGVLYRLEEFFFSFNASNILNKRVSIFDNSEPLKLRNYYAYTGYKFISNSQEYEYEPSLYFKYFEGDGRSVTDLNFKARKITDTGYIWAGINGRFFNDQSFEFSSIAPLLGLKKDQFYVGYTFQWNVGNATDFNSSGTHMITLGFDFESGRGGSSWR